MNYYEMSDEALALHDREVTAQREVAARLNDGDTFTNHPTHGFYGIDGRCIDCDCRPYGRHAPLPCPLA